MKRIIVVIAILLSILLCVLYVHVISGGIPFIEYWYNTIYSDKYEKNNFDKIEAGTNVDSLLKLIGSPLMIKSYKTKNNSEIEVYYYSYIKEGPYLGKIGHVYAKIVLVRNGTVLRKIDKIMPHTNLMIKYIKREEMLE